ncbi:hypothetical protein ACFW04_003093 [Cataglyphis niger]
MHHTPLSDYSVSGPARMTTRGVSSLPAATSFDLRFTTLGFYLSVCASDPRAAGQDRPLLIPGC